MYNFRPVAKTNIYSLSSSNRPPDPRLRKNTRNKKGKRNFRNINRGYMSRSSSSFRKLIVMSLQRKASSNIRRNGKRTLHTSFTNHRLCRHLYGTRSKSVQTIKESLSRPAVVVAEQTPDSSVIYLGSYRKIPEIIDLGDDSCREQIVNEPQIQSARMSNVRFKVYGSVTN
ncbi:hypothetical protein ANTQUA_LOCUS1899 [Anthophora quadrimaculata]